MAQNGSLTSSSSNDHSTDSIPRVEEHSGVNVAEAATDTVSIPGPHEDSQSSSAPAIINSAAAASAAVAAASTIVAAAQAAVPNVATALRNVVAASAAASARSAAVLANTAVTLASSAVLLAGPAAAQAAAQPGISAFGLSSAFMDSLPANARLAVLAAGSVVNPATVTLTTSTSPLPVTQAIPIMLAAAAVQPGLLSGAVSPSSAASTIIHASTIANICTSHSPPFAAPSGTPASVAGIVFAQLAAVAATATPFLAGGSGQRPSNISIMLSRYESRKVAEELQTFLMCVGITPLASIGNVITSLSTAEPSQVYAAIFAEMRKLQFEYIPNMEAFATAVATSNPAVRVTVGTDLLTMESDPYMIWEYTTEPTALAFRNDVQISTKGLKCKCSRQAKFLCRETLVMDRSSPRCGIHNGGDKCLPIPTTIGISMMNHIMDVQKNECAEFERVKEAKTAKAQAASARTVALAGTLVAPTPELKYDNVMIDPAKSDMQNQPIYVLMRIIKFSGDPSSRNIGRNWYEASMNLPIPDLKPGKVQRMIENAARYSVPRAPGWHEDRASFWRSVVSSAQSIGEVPITPQLLTLRDIELFKAIYESHPSNKRRVIAMLARIRRGFVSAGREVLFMSEYAHIMSVVGVPDWQDARLSIDEVVSALSA